MKSARNHSPRHAGDCSAVPRSTGRCCDDDSFGRTTLNPRRRGLTRRSRSKGSVRAVQSPRAAHEPSMINLCRDGAMCDPGWRESPDTGRKRACCCGVLAAVECSGDANVHWRRAPMQAGLSDSSHAMPLSCPQGSRSTIGLDLGRRRDWRISTAGGEGSHGRLPAIDLRSATQLTLR